MKHWTAKLIEMLRSAGTPSVRPVAIDKQGFVFEMWGDRFRMPGLEPEDILEALEDVKHGRVYPQP